jgi:hypothetical protein
MSAAFPCHTRCYTGQLVQDAALTNATVNNLSSTCAELCAGVITATDVRSQSTTSTAFFTSNAPPIVSPTPVGPPTVFGITVPAGVTPRTLTADQIFESNFTGLVTTAAGTGGILIDTATNLIAEWTALYGRPSFGDAFTLTLGVASGVTLGNAVTVSLDVASCAVVTNGGIVAIPSPTFTTTGTHGQTISLLFVNTSAFVLGVYTPSFNVFVTQYLVSAT